MAKRRNRFCKYRYRWRLEKQ